MPGAKCQICRFYADGVEYENALNGQLHELRGFDSVVLALGYVADDRLSKHWCSAAFRFTWLAML